MELPFRGYTDFLRYRKNPQVPFLKTWGFILIIL